MAQTSINFEEGKTSYGYGYVNGYGYGDGYGDGNGYGYGYGNGYGDGTVRSNKRRRPS